MASYLQAIKDSKAYATILADSRNARLSHTYLLLSEDAGYAKAFAKELALIMLGAEGDPRATLQIEHETHPDLMFYGENEKLTTEVVSGISTDVFVRPYEGEHKVYVLFMQNMQDEPQNKLLKTIEEPPKSVFFILIAEQEKQLLQTVLSRSKKIELDLLSKETIARMLTEDGVDKKEVNICSACAGGVYSRARKLATDKEFLALYQNIFTCLYKMNSSRDVLDYAAMFTSKNIDKAELADLFMMIVRDIMMVKQGLFDLVVNSHKLDEMKLIAPAFSMTALYKIIEYCLQLKADLVYNTSVISSIDQFLLRVVEVKVKCK